MLSARIRCLAVIAAAMSLACAGCDRDQAASNSQPAASSPQPAGKSGTDEAGSDDSSAAPAPQAARVASPDVPLPPTVEGEAVRNGFVFFVANDKPANVAAFYQKELEAKGWKLGRNDTKDAGSKLTNVVQQYAKGSDVLTVALIEQIGSEHNMTMAQVMDIPVPPNASPVIPTGVSVQANVPDAPAAALAWFAKELGSRGWSARPAKSSGETMSQGHVKGGRTLNVIALTLPGNKGSSLQLQHLAYAE